MTLTELVYPIDQTGRKTMILSSINVMLKTVVVFFCAFFFSFVTMTARYDVITSKSRRTHQNNILKKIPIINQPPHPSNVLISRDLSSIESSRGVSEGNVDVAIFTVRENRVRLLPQTFFCPKWNRSITYRNARFNVSACKNADVVMFTSGKGFNRFTYWTQLQAQRTITQLWILSSPESAINTIPMWPPLSMRHIHINLSSTFSAESDIPIPYGRYIEFSGKVKIPFRSKLLNDSENFAVWIASHCPLRTWNRSGVVYDLSRYIPLDTYGKCGELECTSGDKRCLSVFRSYKFYLSLENSCCSNYITEKLWEPLMKYEAIPIVIGANKEDYVRVAPPNSFIHIDDFSSIKDLADYLKVVATNLTLYRSYFEWKNYGYIRSHKVYKSVWESEENSCTLLEYVKGVRRLSPGGFDPFGPTWFRGCGACGTRQWLRQYYLYPSQSIYNGIQSNVNITTNKL